MSYSQLKNELPFPTKIVVVPMTKCQLLDAIHYSRTTFNENGDTSISANDFDVNIPRKGYLQVDFDFNNYMTNCHDTSDENKLLQVALPRNLMSGFCNIQPLIKIGKDLKQKNQYPSSDNFIPALDLVTRYCCKAKWMNIVKHFTFSDFDINSDGVLDHSEIKLMLEKFLGHEPSDFVVDDMIQCIDEDENGMIDIKEFSHVVAKMERNKWKR